jgi:hypothetical protein
LGAFLLSPQALEKKPRGAQLHPGTLPLSDADAEATAPYPRSPRWARRLSPKQPSLDANLRVAEPAVQDRSKPSCCFSLPWASATNRWLTLVVHRDESRSDSKGTMGHLRGTRPALARGEEKGRVSGIDSDEERQLGSPRRGPDAHKGLRRASVISGGREKDALIGPYAGKLRIVHRLSNVGFWAARLSFFSGPLALRHPLARALPFRSACRTSSLSETPLPP